MIRKKVLVGGKNNILDPNPSIKLFPLKFFQGDSAQMFQDCLGPFLMDQQPSFTKHVCYAFVTYM